MTQVVVAAVCSFSSVVLPQNDPQFDTEHLKLMVNGVIHVVPNRLLAVNMSNFGDKPTRLPRTSVLGIMLPAPVAIMEVQAGTFPSSTEPLAN